MYARAQQDLIQLNDDGILGPDVRKLKRRVVENLIERYGGITAHVYGPDAIAQSVGFSKLMKEWNPISYRLEDVEAIAGEPTRVEESDIPNIRFAMYEFDDGESSSIWRFKIRGGWIVGIERWSGE